jgi:hypothetical protein
MFVAFVESLGGPHIRKNNKSGKLYYRPSALFYRVRGLMTPPRSTVFVLVYGCVCTIESTCQSASNHGSSAWVQRFTSSRRYCGGGGGKLAALCCCVSHARTTHTWANTREQSHTRACTFHPVTESAIKTTRYNSTVTKDDVQVPMALCLKELESKEALLLHKTTVHPKASEGASAGGAVAGNGRLAHDFFCFTFNLFFFLISFRRFSIAI